MYQKFLFTLILSLFVINAPAAKIDDLSQKPKYVAQRSLSAPAVNIEKDQMESVGSIKDKIGNVHTRSRQTYKGIPIWNYQVIEHQRKGRANERTYSGYYVSNLEKDLAKTAKNIKPEAEVLAFIRDYHLSTKPVASVLEEGQAKSYIYLDQDKVAHQVYEVSFVADAPGGNHPGLPTYIVDAQSLVVYKHWDAMTHQVVGEGPGGNLGTGRYVYGKDFPPLDIQVKASHDVCFMKTDYVKTVNLRNKKNRHSDNARLYPVRFGCHPSRGDYYHDEKMTNGAYGIQNDAHAFGQAIVGMYHDWYDINPLPIRLIMQVHYGNNYPNAMWDPRYLVMSFGDGDNEMMYPLVVLDVAAHEVGHGITQFASDLIYVGESGALNESFSDMAAQAALYYFYGENDWKIGATIMKSGRPLRHMDNPRRDGHSIAHTAEYYDGLDVHYASGIFNKAFYNLATTPGWDTQKAYTVFYYANLTEWFPDETFASAGCGVVRATMALQTYFPAFEPKDVIAALRSVGVYYNGETQTCKT